MIHDERMLIRCWHEDTIHPESHPSDRFMAISGILSGDEATCQSSYGCRHEISRPTLRFSRTPYLGLICRFKQKKLERSLGGKGSNDNPKKETITNFSTVSPCKNRTSENPALQIFSLTFSHQFHSATFEMISETVKPFKYQ